MKFLFPKPCNALHFAAQDSFQPYQIFSANTVQNVLDKSEIK